MCCDGGPKSIGRHKQKLCHCSVRLAKHRVQRSTRNNNEKKKIYIKSTGLEKWFTNIDYPLLLTVNPVYVLHAFPQEHQWKKIWNVSWQTKKKCLKKTRRQRRRETALSQYTNFKQAIVCLHDWAEQQNTSLYARSKNPDQLCVEVQSFYFSFSSCETINHSLISMYSAIHM